MTESPWNKSADAPTRADDVASLKREVMDEIRTSISRALHRTGLIHDPIAVVDFSVMTAAFILLGAINVVDGGYVDFKGRLPGESTLDGMLRGLSEIVKENYRHDPT